MAGVKGMKMNRLDPVLKAECIRLRLEERLSSLEIQDRIAPAYLSLTTILGIIRPYPLTADEMRERHSRTAKAMLARRRLNGDIVGGHTWTPEEDDAIRKLWPQSSWDKIQEAFPGRSPKAIARRASQLKIKRALYATMLGRSKVDPVFRELRAIRESRQISREELADKIGIHRQQLTVWEIGTQRPLWLGLRDWLTALDCELKVIEK